MHNNASIGSCDNVCLFSWKIIINNSTRASGASKVKEKGTERRLSNYCKSFSFKCKFSLSLSFVIQRKLHFSLFFYWRQIRIFSYQDIKVTYFFARLPEERKNIYAKSIKMLFILLLWMTMKIYTLLPLSNLLKFRNEKE